MQSTVVITFTNNSHGYITLPSIHEAITYCRTHITYSHGIVSRVEISDAHSLRTVFDRSWTPESNNAALYEDYL